MSLPRDPIGPEAASRQGGLFRCPPPWTLWLYAPFVAAGVAFSAAANAFAGPSWLLDVVGGLLLWTLLEYAFHRFLFHIEPRSPRLRALNLHLRHHERPQDLAYQVAPFALTGPVALLLLGPLVLATGSWAHGVLATAATMAGYVLYELVHLRVHGTSGGTLVRALRRHHLYHHHADATRCFGFTSPTWDLVFGTARPRGGP